MGSWVAELDRKRLTDARIRSLSAKAKRYEVWDGRGFGVRVALSGRKTFVFLYRFDGRPRRLSFGTYPQTSLADATEKLAKAQKLLDQGIDPGAVALSERRAERDSPTFKDLSEEWIERWAKKNRQTWTEDQRKLDRDILPVWGHRKAKDIKRRDVIELLDKIVDRGAPVIANRTLQLVRQIFNFGVDRDVVEFNPAASIKQPAKEKPRSRVLSEGEIRVFWDKLPGTKMQELSRIALRLCLVTAQRRSEVVQARWSEIDGSWWTIPGSRTKNDQPHRIPLSGLALSLLEELSAISGGTDWLFPSPRGGCRMGAGLSKALGSNRKVFGLERFTVHDLRRTAASHMTALGHSRLVVGKVLNHTDDSITAVYDRHSYEKEKRLALEAWARKITSIIEKKQDSNVVQLA